MEMVDVTKKPTRSQKIEAATVSEYELSLTTMLGKGVKDITGYISNEFGGRTFKLCRLILEDGSALCFEGEHDHPYLTSGYGDKVAEIPEELLEEYDSEDEDE